MWMLVNLVLSQRSVIKTLTKVLILMILFIFSHKPSFWLSFLFGFIVFLFLSLPDPRSLYLLSLSIEHWHRRGKEYNCLNLPQCLLWESGNLNLFLLAKYNSFLFCSDTVFDLRRYKCEWCHPKLQIYDGKHNLHVLPRD